MRLAYVLKRFPRLSETFVLNEILELERRGADVHIFSLLRMGPGLVHPGLAKLRAPVSYPPRGAGGSIDTRQGVLNRARWIAAELAAGGFPHAHAHFATSAVEVAHLASGWAGVGYSFTAHAKDIYHDTVDASRLRRLIAAARFVVTVSDYNVRHLLDLCGGDLASRIVRIYNGIDVDLFEFRGPDGRDPDTILSVGRLIEKKGFADLIDAVALLNARGRRVRLTIVGEGPLETDLRARVTAHGLDAAVAFTGAQPQDRVIELMRTHAVMVLPCVVGADGNRDGLPTVLLEAMAAGLPVVSTRVTGIPEMIRDGVTGLVGEPHRPDWLAGAIERLLDDPALRARMATAARRDVCRRFHLSQNVGRLARLLESHGACGAPLAAIGGVSDPESRPAAEPFSGAAGARP